MNIKNEFEIGETVYLKTDKEQLPRIIIGIQINGIGSILYRLAQGISDSWHFEMEVSADRDISLLVN